MKQRILWAFVLGLALPAVAAAQTKITATISCAKPDPAYSIEAGDRAGHALQLAKFACTWTAPMEVDGVAAKDGQDVATSDGSGTRFHTVGYHVSNMANGDKIFVRFSGTNTMTKDGKPVADGGTWSYIGGTGKFKGIKGKGTYKGKADANGNMVSDIEGVYILPKM
ncbi:MAG TPA: hypothetical protein VKS44_00845 [Candidatus Acidoferrales bacterium]|nr:hypothetical protein [Candidatus Acidoferrales bacterium]